MLRPYVMFFFFFLLAVHEATFYNALCCVRNEVVQRQPSGSSMRAQQMLGRGTLQDETESLSDNVPLRNVLRLWRKLHVAIITQ
uniref:Putative secreted protein n=1 Tax=Ixodes ricinus TaxID=34613 RepID=A0A6B0TXM1_IXORI